MNRSNFLYLPRGKQNGSPGLESSCTLLWSLRCNGHLQSATGAGTAAGSGPRANGEYRGPGRKAEGTVTADLFSEMNLTEIQKLKQQLMTVRLLPEQPYTNFSLKESIIKHEGLYSKWEPYKIVTCNKHHIDEGLVSQHFVFLGFNLIFSALLRNSSSSPLWATY